MQLHLIITQRHIDEGRSGEYNACPIAKVLWEQGYGDVYVDEKVVRVLKGKAVLEAKPPKLMSCFIDDFDNFRPVKPSNFELTFQLTTDKETKPKDQPQSKKLPKAT